MAWTYRCLRQTCRTEFDSERPATCCPKCRGDRLRWIPRKVAIAKSSPGADRELRGIADAYGLTNLRSARAGESAAPQATQPVHQTQRVSLSPLGLSGGIDIPIDANGVPRPTAAFTGDVIKLNASGHSAWRSSALDIRKNTNVVHKDERQVPAS